MFPSRWCCSTEVKSLRSENFQEMLEHGYLMRTDRGIRTTMDFQGDTVHYDATNPGAQKYLWEKAKKNYYSKGMHHPQLGSLPSLSLFVLCFFVRGVTYYQAKQASKPSGLTKQSLNTPSTISTTTATTAAPTCKSETSTPSNTHAHSTRVKKQPARKTLSIC